MQDLSAQALPLVEWLDVLDREYLEAFLPAGGGALKLAIAEDAALAAALPLAAALAARRGLQHVHIDAAATRVHMPQELVFAIARALPWETLIQRLLERIFAANDYPWPQPGAAMTMAELAAAFATAPGLLARERDRWLSRAIWDDKRLAQDMRAALLRLCLARLEGEDAAPVLAWLRGETVPLSLLRAADIGARISRGTARAVLVSLCHVLRMCGSPGLLLTLDLRQISRPGAVAAGAARYSAAATMDAFEVLRELIDDAEHLPGLLVLALAGPPLIAGDPRRTLAQYAALQMRVWPDVRPGDRQNPVAPLVWLA